MRAPFLAVALVAALSGACASVHPITKEDRVAASRALQAKPAGTVLTAGEMDRLDLDHTYVCDTEYRVGSHIPTYQCRSLRRMERERAAARGFIYDNSGEAIQGCLPPETSRGDVPKDLLANGGSSKAAGKDEHPAQGAADTADQDPRFPPL